MPAKANTFMPTLIQSKCSSADPANSGTSANAGITARSWNNSTEKPSCPDSLRFIPFSRISCNAIAVDDIARPMPPTTAACQEKSVSINNPARTSALSNTCAAPTPKIERRNCHSLAGLSSSPMMNIRKTTPSSEKCRISSTSLMNPSPHGPIAIPASK